MTSPRNAGQHPSAAPPPPFNPAPPEVAQRGAALARRMLDASGTPDPAERRAMVLKHPDLAARLREPPLDYVKAAQWNGFIPPELFNGERNDSPRRAALLRICAEAERREAGT